MSYLALFSHCAQEENNYTSRYILSYYHSISLPLALLYAAMLSCPALLHAKPKYHKEEVDRGLDFLLIIMRCFRDVRLIDIGYTI